MTWGELKKLVEAENITDDFQVDIVGEHSKGSWGEPLKVKKSISNTPVGGYKELQIFIKA